MKVIIVGGVTAGPKTASKIIRLCPDAEVTIIEKGEFLSYAGCGLPYYISGVVKEQNELMETPVGVVRDSVFFHNIKNVNVLNRTEVTAIDCTGKKVKINGKDDGEKWLDYDKLVLATGADAIKPGFPGIELGNIFTLKGVEDAEHIKELLAKNLARDVVIVGGGLIGAEVAEALVESGCRLTIVEMLPNILPMLDPEMAILVEKYFESKGVRIMTDSPVTGFEGDGKVNMVLTQRGNINADMVVLAIGVRPTVKLAKDCGLELGPTGAIKVNEKMQTSIPDIFAAGDCAEKNNLITGKPCYVPLGSTANKEGRVAANNVCGYEDSFPGVIGSSVCKIFDYTIARTGLGEKDARDAGYDVVTCLAPAPDKAHFMPDAETVMLKLTADAKSRKLLGAQAIGLGVADKRIDVAATLITAGMTVDQLAQLDLAYAPPYASAVDIIITAANIIRNKMDGHMVGITSAEVKKMLDDGVDCTLLDVRSPAELEVMRLEQATHIPLGSLRNRVGELDRDKPVVAFCKISLRGYEAALILLHAGFKDVKVMDGGIQMWPYEMIKG